MKRSEINNAMIKALKLFNEYKISLPPFVLWTPEEWANKGEEVDEIRDNMLGWDITDFGSGDFNKMGLLIFPKPFNNSKFCIFRAPTWITSTCSNNGSWDKSIISVTMGSPVFSFASSKSVIPSARIP